MYSHCLACDKPLSSSEMGRAYDSAPEEYIGLCGSCLLISNIRVWTSRKSQENNKLCHYDEWNKKLYDLMKEDEDIHNEED